MEQIKREETKHGVYFANLSEYNNGRMVGGWLYPLDYDSFDSFYIAIKEVTRNADEVAVHDYDDFPNMGEYPDHDELYKVIHAVDDSHIDNEVLFKYMANQHDYSIDLVEEAENSYINTYEDFQKFANEYADEEIINNVNKEAQQFVFSNFDYESYAYDLRHSFDSFKLSTYEVAIFHQS
jgi:type IV secretory pathway TrbF-like protein